MGSHSANFVLARQNPKKTFWKMSTRKKNNGWDKDYEEKRNRNNEAVKKSREKAKQKSDEIAKTIERLTSENQDLEERKLMLNKELSLLKELFVSYGGNEIN